MNQKVGIVLWLYDQSLCDEFLQLLIPLKSYIKVYLQLCSDNDTHFVIDKFTNSGINYIPKLYPNCGMDVLPFLNILPEISEPYFIKLHGKRSLLTPHDHINWRALLVNSLVGSQQTFLHNSMRMINDNSIGIICNEHLIMNNIGTNLSQINKVLQILEMNNELVGSPFVGGNMFMSRTNIFTKYLYGDKLLKIKQLLESYPGKLYDTEHGTYAHALERIFGYIIKYERLQFSPSYTHIIRIHKNSNTIDRIIKMYNGDCYFINDMIDYGKITDHNTKQITIQWLHMDKVATQVYDIHEGDSIVKTKSL